MLVIPDTNFLMYLTKYKLWHEFENLYEVIILPEVYFELEVLKQNLVLDLIKKFKINFLRSNKERLNADKAIIENAKELKAVNREFIVATLDKDLVKRLKKLDVKILTIRQNKYLKVT